MRIVRTLGRHLTDNFVAYLALAVAMSGTAYAAATIGSADVIDNSLKSVDVRNDTSTGGGLLGKDIRNNALRGADILESSLARVPNADNLDGISAENLTINGYAQVEANSDFNSDAHKVVHVFCPVGTRVLGGGGEIFPSVIDASRDAASIVIRASIMTGDTGWHIIADEIGAGYADDWKIIVDAVCGK